MTGPAPIHTDDRLQYMAFAAMALAATVATAILYVFRVPYFRLYFGSINPLLAMVIVTALGTISLRFLHVHGWFEIYTKQTFRGAAISAALATMFAIVVIAVDLTAGFPRDLNVPAPWSLLFYPAMAYVVEVCFHAVPLALLLGLRGSVSEALNRNRLLWICILVTAFLEPVFQLWAGYATGKHFSGLAVFAGLQVFAINLLQLHVFRRYGFLAMYSFRLVYYFYWHILWGFLRLKVLF